MIKIFNFEEIEQRIDSHIIDLPPSIHSYYSFFRGRQQITKTGIEYTKYIQSLNLKKFGVDEEVDIYIDYYFKTNASNDIDNPLKCLFDSLTKVDVITDDKYIKKLVAEKFWPKDLVDIHGKKAPKNFRGGMYLEIKSYKNLRKLNINT